MISSLVCGSLTIISLTSSGTGMVRRREKVAPMAARVESCSCWFLAARLVTNIPGGERRRRREEEGRRQGRRDRIRGGGRERGRKMYVRVEVVLSESDSRYENSQPKVQARNFHFKGRKKKRGTCS